MFHQKVDESNQNVKARDDIGVPFMPWSYPSPGCDIAVPTAGSTGGSSVAWISQS